MSTTGPKTELSNLVRDDPAPADKSSSSTSCCCCGGDPCLVIDRPLLASKGFYLSFIGGLGCVLPFLSIYFKQLGLSPQQIGLISGLRPIIGFSSGPLWGMLADRFSVRRVLLIISLLSWVGVFVALAFVPPAARLDDCPETLVPHRPVIEMHGGSHHGSRQLREQTAGPHHERGTDYEQRSSTSNSTTTYNLTDAEQSVLRESIGWIYDPAELSRVFVTVLLLILLGEFVQSPTTALSDAGTLEALGPDKLELYGNQRAWGPVGWAIASVTVGALVALTRRPENVCGVLLYFSDYFAFVYIFLGFMFIAFICATQIPFKDSSSKEKDASQDAYSSLQVLRVFMNIHYGSWLIAAFFVGVLNGVIWGFLSWHLDNLGGDQLLIGSANLVNCVAEFIMFFFVHHIIRRFGHMGIMYGGLVGYSIRFAGYASLVNPWWVMPFEILQGVTFSCVWVSLTAYSTLAVPPSSLATIQGILHGVYFGLGNGTGHLIGGLLIGEVGAAITFSAFSGFSILVALGLLIAQKCSTKPEFDYQVFESEMKEEKKQPEKDDK